MGKDSKPKDAKGKGKQAAGSSGGDDGGGKGGKGKGKGKGGKSADGLGTCTYVKGTVPSPLPWMYCTRGCLMMLGENLRGYDQISRFWTYGGASGVQ
jgi:hypothetical protein